MKQAPANKWRVHVSGRGLGAALAVFVLAFVVWPVRVDFARAMGQGVDVRRVRVTGLEHDARPTAAERLAWEVRKRTSIETQLTPGSVRFDDPNIFQTPFLYWSGDRPFASLSEAEITGLRRFVEYGGFVLIDDATPELDGFDQSVRRELVRAFPSERLLHLPDDHTLYRSFYLVDRPVGRIAEPDYLEAVVHAGRAAVIYSRHDLGGAWARDDRGQTVYDIVPGGAMQREQSIRLGVNVVMYALCLDYKDDQVHAPFILRRRGGRP
jgi:hypothetical protein